MRDIFIKIINSMSNAPESDLGYPFTFILSGCLVSGKVISFQKFIEENEAYSAILNTAKDGAKNLEPDEFSEESVEQLFNPKDEFIHLKDAKVYLGVNPIPTKEGVYIRLAVDSIQGFSLGEIFPTITRH
jgi:hypothetical protein